MSSGILVASNPYVLLSNDPHFNNKIYFELYNIHSNSGGSIMSAPKLKDDPTAIIKFENLDNKNYGYLFSKVEYKCMVNGGYIIKATITDSNYNLLRKLVSGLPENYFNTARSNPIIITTQILYKDGIYPETATKPIVAFVTALRSFGDEFDVGYIEFIAIDPASWYLSTGDASGRAFKGNISKVLKSVISTYAPNITADISETRDSKENTWHMNRMDPKSFILSLLEWSSAVTNTRTNWIITQDDYNIAIKEQGILKSKQRAYYTRRGASIDTIRAYDLLIDNALSIIQTKLITNGLSATSGKYFDIINDKNEQEVVAKDTTTTNKQIAKAAADRSTSKPSDDNNAGPTTVGFSAIQSIPEVYSAGDIGLKYGDYIDGAARSTWLRLANKLFRVKFSVLGHGEWSGGTGLGVDTIYITWKKAATGPVSAQFPPSGEDTDDMYFLTGNWLVYGYHHILVRGKWSTDLYCARFDYDSNAKQVGV